MKGMTHFLVGVAIASFVSAAVEATMIEHSFILLLGGVFGILPDTLDFRFARYFEHHDVEASPGETELDPRRVVDAIAEGIETAWREKRTVKVKLHSIKVGSDAWRQYTVRLDDQAGKVTCRIGPLVTTGQVPHPGTEPKGNMYAERAIRAPLRHTYSAETTIDIWHGNDYAFVPQEENVRVDFIPWHRRWSHSLTLGLLLAPLGFLFYGLSSMGLWAAVIIAGAFWGHVIVDQLGMLGSNLFYPFTKRRARGMYLTSSGDKLDNLYTNLLAVSAIFFNFNAALPKPAFIPWPAGLWVDDLAWPGGYLVSLAVYWGLYLIPPMIVIGLLYRWYNRRAEGGEAMTKEALEQADIISETEDPSGG